jgi:dihydrofolate reductase
MITLIAAIGANGEIGKDNSLLWNIPEEMKVFIKHTKGKTVLMGRKTFESIGSRPLPNRTNIVISRTMPETAGVHVYSNIADAIKDHPDVVVMGGEQIYRECLSIADQMIISHVCMSFPDADSHFPVCNQLLEKSGELLHDGSPFFSTYKYTKGKGENSWDSDSADEAKKD